MTSDTPRVSIVIPVWGNFELIDACLRAIEDHTPPDLYEVVIVDNTNVLDLPEYAKHVTTIIHNAENLGYGAGSNQGVEHASAGIVCLLNCDTEVQEGWLPPLLAAFDDPAVVMVGPRIIHPAGDLQTSGIRTWHGQGSAGGEEIKQELPTRDVDGVTGACMLIRRGIFEKLGQFDTDFVNGYEDVALCLTVQEAGYRARYIAESTVMHHESITPGRWDHASDNVQLMNQRWGNR